MGTMLWYFQRLSAIFILAYVSFLVFSYLVKPYDIQALTWVNDMQSINMKIFSSLFLVSMFFHGIMGLKAVEDDYLSARTLGFISEPLSKISLIFRISYRIFIALVIFVTTYVFIFNYLA